MKKVSLPFIAGIDELYNFGVAVLSKPLSKFLSKLNSIPDVIAFAVETKSDAGSFADEQWLG